MFLPSQKNIRMMGVINLTPDSFSDGLFHQDPDNFQKTLEQFQSDDILDIGMESTAPTNNVISVDTEISRFNLHFVPHINSLLIANLLNLSIDTYKIETIEYVLDILEDYPFKIIWNDISGHLSPDVFRILKKYPNVSYVYCYNLAGEVGRDIGSGHLSFASEHLELLDVENYFKKALLAFIQNAISTERVYLDMCFGFSKTFEQNIFLLENMDSLLKIHNKWVFGISKKSFLRKLVQIQSPGTSDLFEGSEEIHLSYLRRLSAQIINEEVLIRLHNPLIFRKAFMSESY